MPATLCVIWGRLSPATAEAVWPAKPEIPSPVLYRESLLGGTPALQEDELRGTRAHGTQRPARGQMCRELADVLARGRRAEMLTQPAVPQASRPSWLMGDALMPGTQTGVRVGLCARSCGARRGDDASSLRVPGAPTSSAGCFLSQMQAFGGCFSAFCHTGDSVISLPTRCSQNWLASLCFQTGIPVTGLHARQIPTAIEPHASPPLAASCSPQLCPFVSLWRRSEHL